MNTCKIIKIIVPVIVLMSLSGCKTNEDNYRAAYEVALQHQQGDVDPETGSLMKNEEMPSATVVGTDTLRMKTEIVAVYAEKRDGNAVKMFPYNVVVGQFRQVFNAKAMRDRLKSYGYSPYIVATREPLYYVVASGCSTKADVAELVERIESDKNLVMKLPFPWVLKPVGISE